MMIIGEAATNHDGNRFVNLVETSIESSETPMGKMISKMLFENRGERKPKGKVENVPVNLSDFSDSNSGLRFSWLGHSSILINLSGINILTDPVFSGKALGPAKPIGPKPFPYVHHYEISNLPDIDVVLISHDHFDHLEKETITEFRDSKSRFLVPKGIARLLIKWGISPNRINEMDWYEEIEISDIRFILTPSRHFSGRSVTDRYKTLWGSWVMKNNNHSIFFSGDTGYFDEFSTIGEQYGPFDIAFMECGQYSEDWHQIHLLPSETVQAGIDVKGKVLMPIHWGKFSLGYHGWLEPIREFSKEAVKRNVSYISPQIGEVIAEPFEKMDWWNTNSRLTRK